LVNAAKAAHIHEEIEALPNAYDTLLGAGAADLSGGQRQRIGLARAFAGSPSVIVFDEPTAALDMRSEELVQQTIRDRHGVVTMLIVAHRVSTMSVCDRLLVLRAGKVEAFGEPAEVAVVSPFYAETLRLVGVNSHVHASSGLSQSPPAARPSRLPTADGTASERMKIGPDA
jgi:ABC-type multidrug transport system fused ATPase/permease subunit